MIMYISKPVQGKFQCNYLYNLSSWHLGITSTMQKPVSVMINDLGTPYLQCKPQLKLCIVPELDSSYKLITDLKK